MEAFASFFRSIQKKAQQRYYPLVPEMLNILPPLKESGDSDSLIRALVALIELAEVAPKMFKHQFPDLVKFSIAVIKDKDLGDQARQNALELMATFADYNAAMCRKDADYTREMVTQCLGLMTDIGMDDENADEWNSSEDVCVYPGLVIEAALTSNSWMWRKATSTTLQVNNAWTALPISLEAKPFYRQHSIGFQR